MFAGRRALMATTGRIEAKPISLPFQGIEPMARHCGYQGARHAAERVGRQCLALLALYRGHGPLTDARAAFLLRLERTTINARRNELVKLGLVRAVDTEKNDTTGIRNVRWGLVATEKE